MILLQDRLNAYKVKQGLNYFDTYTVTLEEGRKYLRIYANEVTAGTVRHTRIVAFINSLTGDILKPATYKAPAKHARGNVTSDKWGMEAFDSSGHVRRLA